MLATSKNGLFPGHNHLLTSGADDPCLEVASMVVTHGGYLCYLVDSGFFAQCKCFPCLDIVYETMCSLCRLTIVMNSLKMSV